MTNQRPHVQFAIPAGCRSSRAPFHARRTQPGRRIIEGGPMFESAVRRALWMLLVVSAVPAYDRARVPADAPILDAASLVTSSAPSASATVPTATTCVGPYPAF